jgi:hypothetical protein
VQHPSEHDDELHTQAWFEQIWPLSQAEDCPHWQTPAEEQLSAIVRSHVRHPVPPVPQLPIPEVLHTSPTQHPAHDVVQMQDPLEHVCPTEHSVDPLPSHEPVWLLQLSDRVGSHTEHAAPPVPHIPAVGGEMHVEPLQHPFGQVASEHPLQTPAVQVPPPHTWHALPPIPHAEGASVVTHCPAAEQQPLGHEF